ncbi:hypothetical protein SAMN04488570_0594 [Nocardioides scoriae]|uniref:DUF2304 domain-containing protein n=1 Tax=Nocardioides scoriae TaxID=642780 RepID=A0A1H1MJN1_9ACTN|nr:DUF2304 domain-containing protein [Nocardioides scoriae]SDR86585.1 hypothetical protein SAMN04488570_0594 [Nocardioides scoriae]
MIKALLVLAAVGVAVLLLRESVPGQKLLLRRLAGLAGVVAGIVAILWPQSTTLVANLVGVGRGTDLVLYVAVFVFLYYAVATSQRLHHLERQNVELARALALATADEPGAALPGPAA